MVDKWGIDWQLDERNDDSKIIQFIPVTVEEKGHWPTEDEAFSFLGEAAGQSRQTEHNELTRCYNRVHKCIESGHHSVLEHLQLSVLIGCDRGTSHAIVRHRHCAFTQSSTVYGKVNNGPVKLCSLPVEDPVTKAEVPLITYQECQYYVEQAKNYKRLQEELWAERTRDHLPTSYYTTIFMSANLREMIYFVQRRKDPTTSVRIHCVAYILEKILSKHYPMIWGNMSEWYSAHPL